MTRRVSIALVAVTLLSASLLSGCAGIRDHRGYVMDKTLVAAIQPGVDNRDSVQKTLGRPTLAGQFSDRDWYYLSRDTTSLAFRSPRVKDQTVLHVAFDAVGNVATVERTGKEKVASINPVNKSTPTLGRKRSFFDEIFGNIGMVGSGAPLGGGGNAPGQ